MELDRLLAADLFGKFVRLDPTDAEFEAKARYIVQMSNLMYEMNGVIDRVLAIPVDKDGET